MLQEDSLKEGEIIARTLRMSNKKSQYVYVRNRRELECVIEEFGRSKFRYLHLSCHGSEHGFYTTLDFIPSKEMADLLSPSMNGRRLFVSSCLATNSVFARTLIKDSNCLSVLGPKDSIAFDDAAVFWISFYHLMFKANREHMKGADIKSNVSKCASLVGEKFRYFERMNGGSMRQLLLPLARLPSPRT
jgi:hypothetical protein